MNDVVIPSEKSLKNAELETKLYINNQLFKKHLISDEMHKKATDILLKQYNAKESCEQKPKKGRGYAR